jgi:hypothetical protein
VRAGTIGLAVVLLAGCGSEQKRAETVSHATPTAARCHQGHVALSGHFHGQYCVLADEARVELACLEAQYELEVAGRVAYDNLLAPGDLRPELETAARESAVILSNAENAVRSSGESAEDDLSWLARHRKWVLAFVGEVRDAHNFLPSWTHWWHLFETHDLACQPRDARR